MITLRASRILVFGAALLGACGGSGPDDNQVVECTGVPPTTLAVGESRVIDAAEQGCVRLPEAGAAGAEHLYVALSGEGTQTASGTTAEYQLSGGPISAASRVGGAVARTARLAGPAGRFHDGLRARERELAAEGGAAASVARAAAGSVRSIPPEVGSQRTFKVCQTPRCQAFVDATATARVVADRVAIYLDDAAPGGGYTEVDLQNVARLFDEHLYPIDTVAFGRESDIDANQVVIVLLTPRINQLSPNCNTTGSVILGYFFGLDLLPTLANSNAGEIFYGLVPDPDNPSCSVSRSYASAFLPPVFIHEFQHMISFNQHVLVAGGNATEDTWLNEGLSHFAEELGGRLVPDTECQPLFDSCESQFIGSNIENAYDYLDQPEASFLIEPGDSQGELAERGANWLFVRWLVDHFAGDQPLGSAFTRRLVQTRNRGSVNVATETARPFDELVAEWQLTNYVEDLPGFQPLSSRLRYTSWALRDLFQTNFDDGVFAKPYPLTPLVTSDGNVALAGTLRGGSGVHLRVVQPASAPELQLRLTGDDGESPVSESARPRIALVRIR